MFLSLFQKQDSKRILRITTLPNIFKIYFTYTQDGKYILKEVEQ